MTFYFLVKGSGKSILAALLVTITMANIYVLFEELPTMDFIRLELMKYVSRLRSIFFI